MSQSAAASPSRIARGRLFFANPGPTNIPDSILHAVAHSTVDFMSPEFLALYDNCMEGMKRVLKTRQNVFFYTASGHGAWEAALVNLLSPGDTLLIIETGYFSLGWAEMATALGVNVQTVAADWRQGVDMAAVEAALAADTEHKIKAVGVVHNETATGVALHATSHPALLMADTISSLACFDFRMDEWGVDVAVGGSQKGLMLPTGMSFTGVSDKALVAHKASTMPKHYMNWSAMIVRRHKSFIGTVPVSLFFGLAESLRLLDEEGLERVYDRHHRLADATRAAVRTWSGNNGPQLFCQNPARMSDSVTAIRMPDGHDAEKLRKLCYERFNLSLGGGLGPLGGKVFRIGHMGDLNEPMILGTLATVELALGLCGIPHGKGGVDSAIASLAAG